MALGKRARAAARLPQKEGDAQIGAFMWVGQVATCDFLDTANAVYQRIAVQEQQATALLGVAIVVEVDFECMQEIRLVFTVVFGKAVDSGMQQTLKVGAALDFRNELVESVRYFVASVVRCGCLTINHRIRLPFGVVHFA